MKGISRNLGKTLIIRGRPLKKKKVISQGGALSKLQERSNLRGKERGPRYEKEDPTSASSLSGVLRAEQKMFMSCRVMKKKKSGHGGKKEGKGKNREMRRERASRKKKGGALTRGKIACRRARRERSHLFRKNAAARKRTSSYRSRRERKGHRKGVREKYLQKRGGA